MRTKYLIYLTVLIFFVVSMSGMFVYLPIGNIDKNQITLIINSGDSLNTISRKLNEHSLVSHAFLFKLTSIILGKRRSYKSGEYKIADRISIINLIDLLDKGQTALVSVTIPEGQRIIEIEKILKQKGFINLKKFISLCSNAEFIRSFDIIPDIYTLEGFLFPDTYRFSKAESEYTILRVMIKTFFRNIPDDYKHQARKAGLSYYEAIILASIIEKETSVAFERRIISSVFHNRLKNNMPLQTDPTVIYGIKNFDGNLTKRQLRTKTPYNTYIVRGLPPTPISNPGLASLMAAVQPADSRYLYFVAKGDGTHKFSTNYRDHRRSVKRFQKIRRANYRSF